jgi:4-amino-4-deoxy-L-arabinose transferase-like glycosyltransferase
MGHEISTNRQFGMGTPRFDPWIDRCWLMGLFVAAVVLFGVSLGDLPLRDWDEGIVAQVAREMARSPFGSDNWIYPKELTGNPYFNKPPLVHWLMALLYSVEGVNEWTSRLPGAMLTACSVPLMYWIGRELFFQRSAAVFTALVYLTSLPVVRHGRLAMLDGAVLCFFLWLMACLLRSRRDLRWGLGVGIGFGLLCLTKGILAVLLGAIALIFLIWDTPRLVLSRYLWCGVLLGVAPVALWYIAQWEQYHQTFIDAHLLNQSAKRVWETVGPNRGPVWYYLIELLKWVPWLVFLPSGFRLAWDNRTLSWAKLALLWSVIYFVTISVMKTKLPWYVLPIYPALSLVVGAQLSRMWDPLMAGIIQARPIAQARLWCAVFLLLAVVAGVGSAYYTLKPDPQPDLQLVFLTLAFTLIVTAILIIRQDTQFVAVLLWGTYLTLLVLMMSNHWVWELSESYPVKPVAEMIRKATPRGQVIYTSYAFNRPSLNFYSDRAVIPASPQELQQHWKTDPHPYQLLRRSELTLSPKTQAWMVEDWVLVTRNPVTRLKPKTLKPKTSAMVTRS